MFEGQHILLILEQHSRLRIQAKPTLEQQQHYWTQRLMSDFHSIRLTFKTIHKTQTIQVV